MSKRRSASPVRSGPPNQAETPSDTPKQAEPAGHMTWVESCLTSVYVLFTLMQYGLKLLVCALVLSFAVYSQDNRVSRIALPAVVAGILVAHQRRWELLKLFFLVAAAVMVHFSAGLAAACACAITLCLNAAHGTVFHSNWPRQRIRPHI